MPQAGAPAYKKVSQPRDCTSETKSEKESLTEKLHSLKEAFPHLFQKVRILLFAKRLGIFSPPWLAPHPCCYWSLLAALPWHTVYLPSEKLEKKHPWALARKNSDRGGTERRKPTKKSKTRFCCSSQEKSHHRPRWLWSSRRHRSRVLGQHHWAAVYRGPLQWPGRLQHPRYRYPGQHYQISSIYFRLW